jgi:hypothetical protein
LDWWNNTIKMILFILLQTIFSVESQYIKDSSEKKMLELVTKLIKDQNCAIQLVSETFEKGSTALSLIENLQESTIPASISTTLQDARGNKHCHLNVVISKSNQFVDRLDFKEKVEIIIVSITYDNSNIIYRPIKIISSLLKMMTKLNMFSDLLQEISRMLLYCPRIFTRSL